MFQVFFCFLKGYNCEKLHLFFTVKSLLSFDLFVRLFTLNVYSIYSIGDHCYHFIWWLLNRDLNIAFSNHLAERSLALHSSQNSLVYSSRCLLSLDSLKFPVRNKARRMGDSRSTSTMLLTETTVPLEALLTHSYWILASKLFADMSLKFWFFWLRCDWSSMLLWFLVKQRQIPLITIFFLGKMRKDWMIRAIFAH